MNGRRQIEYEAWYVAQAKSIGSLEMLKSSAWWQ
jgi:hypothetical protein